MVGFGGPILLALLSKEMLHSGRSEDVFPTQNWHIPEMLPARKKEQLSLFQAKNLETALWQRQLEEIWMDMATAECEQANKLFQFGLWHTRTGWARTHIVQHGGYSGSSIMEPMALCASGSYGSALCGTSLQVVEKGANQHGQSMARVSPTHPVALHRGLDSRWRCNPRDFRYQQVGDESLNPWELTRTKCLKNQTWLNILSLKRNKDDMW